MSTFKATLELDATGAITNLNDFEKQIKRGVMGSKELGETGAEAMESVAEETKAATRTLADIRKELKNVTNELAGVEDGSEAFTQLTQKAGALRNEIGDITAAINANAGPAVENLGNNFGNLQSSLTSLDFAGATRAAKGFSSQIGQVNFASLTKGASEFGKTILSLGKALLTNPIFLLAAVVVSVGVAFVKLKDSIKPIKVVMDSISDAISFVVDSLKALSDWLGISSFAAEEAAQNQIAAAASRVEALEKSYDQEIKLAQAAGKKTLKLEIEKTKALLEQYRLQGEALKELFFLKGELSEEEKKQLDDTVKNIQNLNNELAVLLVKQETEIANENAKNQEEKKRRAQETANKIKAINDKAAKEEEDRLMSIADLNKKAEEQKLKDRAELLAEVLAIEEDFQTQIDNARLSDEDRALQSLQDYYFELKTRAKAAKIDITEIERIEEIKRQEIRDEFAEKRRLAAEKEAAEQKARDEQKLEQERALQDAKFQLAQNYAAAATSVNDALVASGAVSAEQGFRIGKALAASQTAINTLQGIVSAMAAPPIVPHAVKVKNAISIGVLGAANIAKILATKFGGGSAGSVRPSIGGGGGAGSATQPATGIGGLQLTDIDNRPQQPRAYVIASDVTSQTEAAQKIADRARL
jgi:hypothetical protein